MSRGIVYYGVYQRGLLVQHMNEDGDKMPLILVGFRNATKVAKSRTKRLKKPNIVKAITI